MQEGSTAGRYIISTVLGKRKDYCGGLQDTYQGDAASQILGDWGVSKCQRGIVGEGSSWYIVPGPLKLFAGVWEGL